MLQKTFRPLFILILIAVQLFAGITPALAASPVNDNFTDAVTIEALPFSHSVDTTEAGIEPDEQQWCSLMSNTVWYKFTPMTGGTVQINMAGTTFPDTMLNVYQDNGNGMSGLSWLGCSFNVGEGGRTLDVQSGVTYYFQAGSYSGGIGDLHINVQAIPPPVNDNFVDAIAISPSIPVDVSGTTFASSSEAGEPRSSCYDIDPGPTKTVWYSFTPSAGGTISAGVPVFASFPVIAVYTGDSLANLTEIGCQSYSNLVTFVVEAGTTYYFQIGDRFPWESSGLFQLHVDTAPPPQALIFMSISDPSRHDTINFQTGSFDPANIGIESYEWNFGDGTTGSGFIVPHQYAKDGDYLVTHTVITFDGRIASATQTVQVRTHDVAITRITAPISANSGQTKTVTVALRNTNYPAQVQIDLYKSTPTGFAWVSSVIKSVPALAGNRTTNVSFNYKFTSEDAVVGKVTFKVIVTILNARDAILTDNEAYSSPPTKVAR